MQSIVALVDGDGVAHKTYRKIIAGPTRTEPFTFTHTGIPNIVFEFLNPHQSHSAYRVFLIDVCAAVRPQSRGLRDFRSIIELSIDSTGGPVIACDRGIFNPVN